MANEKKPKVEEDISKSVKELSDINKSLKKLVAIKNLEKYGRTPEQRKQKRGWEKEKATTEKMLEESRGQSKAQTVNQKLSEKFHVQERKDRMKIMKDVWKKQTVGGASPAFATQAFKNQRNVFTKLSTTMKQMGGILKPTGAGGSDKDKNPMKNAMMGVMKFAVGGSIVGMLGKKLFDSSPLLKTMMSLFNTSIMLIFRPIGDFIGSFLRPIMLFFMKNIAIPFYKNSKHAMGIGEQMGKKALGFLLKPVETIHAAIVMALANAGLAPLMGEDTVNRARDYSGVHAWQLEQGEKMGIISSEMGEEIRKGIDKIGWQPFKKSIDYLYSGGKLGGNGKQYGITPTATSTPGTPAAIVEEYFAEVETNAEATAGHMEEVETFMARALIDGQLIESEWDQLQEIMGRAVLAGVDIKNSIFFIKDEMEKSGARLSNRWATFKASNINAGAGIHSTKLAESNQAIDMWKTGIFSTATGTNFEINSGGIAKSALSPTLNPAINSVASQKARTDAYTHLTNPGKGTKSYQDRIEGKSLDEILGIQKAMGIDSVSRLVVGDKGSEILKAVEGAKADGSVKFGNDKEARKHAAAYGAAMTLYNMVGGAKPVMGDLTNIINGKPAGSKGYAHGGLITEPIFGVGRSGQTYTFGERGQETVTPGKGGTNYILNINVGNVTREADFDKLKPLIQRWILEANSRRGVV